MRKLFALSFVVILTTIMYLPKPVSAQDNVNTYTGSLEKIAQAHASFNEGAAIFMNDGIIKYGLTDGRWHCWNGDQIIINPYVQYDFPTEVRSDLISVYWYDDGGGVRLPDGVSISVWTNDEWKTVSIAKSIMTGCHQLIQFEEATFNKIRLTINNSTVNAASGIVEWKVYPSNVTDPNALAVADSSYYFGSNMPLYMNDDAIAYDLLDGRWTSYSGDNVIKNPQVSYQFLKPVVSNMIKIYWYDDGGGVRLPDSVKVEVIKKGASEWTGVDVIRDCFSGKEEVIVFAPVTFSRMRLTINNTTSNAAAGIAEWDVYPYDPYEVGVYAAQSAGYTNPGDALFYLNDGSGSNRWTCYGNYENPWIQYDFNEAVKISKSAIYWYDDGSGVKQPGSVTAMYWDGSSWKPVNVIQEGKAGLRTTILFETVTTDKLRITAINPEAAFGITEWKVYKEMDIVYLHEFAAANASYTNPGDHLTNLNDGSFSGRWTCYGNHEDIYIEYSFTGTDICNRTEIVWYNDNGGVKYPKDIDVYYFEDNEYKKVQTISKETVNGITTVVFEPVKTDKLRVTIEGNNAACGILEWTVTGYKQQVNPETGDPSGITFSLITVISIFPCMRKRVYCHEE